MLTIFSEEHRLHDAQKELIDGRLSPPFENPRRADAIVEHVREVGLGEIRAPDDHGLRPVERVHDSRFVAFLRSAHEDWRERHGDTEALPLCWPQRTLRQIEPADIDGRLGYYSFDAGTPITAGTWSAITAAANVALTGARGLGTAQRAAFALCRPPGHHASADLYGGYCFLNNAAIAAQALLDRGADRVAVLDLDYHHGNGTQSIFYGRDDVMFVSLHGHPDDEYPYFLGRADETGAGAGEGFDFNLPMRLGADWREWSDALTTGLARVRDAAPDALVISLGVDTYEHDPISQFRLKTVHYLEVGRMIAAAGLPTLFVMEGGYAIDALAVNVVNVLQGFEAGGT